MMPIRVFLPLCALMLAGVSAQAAPEVGCHATAPQEQSCTFSFTASRDVRGFILRAPATAGLTAARFSGGGFWICAAHSPQDDPFSQDDTGCVFAGEYSISAGDHVEGTVVGVGSGRFSIRFVYER